MSFDAGDTPLLLVSFYFSRWTETASQQVLLDLKIVPMDVSFVRKTRSCRKFGWGGTSVKWGRRCPPGVNFDKNRNFMWTQIGKCCMMVIFSTNTNCERVA